MNIVYPNLLVRSPSSKSDLTTLTITLHTYLLFTKKARTSGELERITQIHIKCPILGNRISKLDKCVFVSCYIAEMVEFSCNCPRECAFIHRSKRCISFASGCTEYNDNFHSVEKRIFVTRHLNAQQIHRQILFQQLIYPRELIKDDH